MSHHVSLGRRCALMGAALAVFAAAAPAVASAKTYVSCYSYASGYLKFRAHPSTCVFSVLGAPGDPGMTANTVYVDTLKWKHWGDKKATATGVEHGNMDTSFQARVTLSQRVTCNGRTAYNKVTIRNGSEVVFSFKLYACDVGE